MRALFIKGLKQGRPLVIFAAVMGVLLVAAYAAVGRFLLLYGGLETEVLSYAFGIAAAAIAPLFAVFASAGVVAGEAHAGTLPVLFGLPLSRLRIWASLALAALALATGGGLLLLAIARVALRSPFLSMSLSAHLPDAVFFTLFLLSVGLVCSGLARSVTAALASTVVLAGGFVGGASALVFYYGAPITGVPVLDLALWCFLSSPALLLGSALSVSRGELLTGFRKWLYSVPVTALALALTVVIVCAAVRTATGYRRSAVAEVRVPGTMGDVMGTMTQGSTLLPLMTAGGGVTVSRARGDVISAWPIEQPTLGTALRELKGAFHSYTRLYTIALDLSSGKEALIERAPSVVLSQSGMSMGCSADGRMVAMVAARQGFTWGRNESAPPELRIYDGQTGRLVARSGRDLLDSSDLTANLSWSPSGKYLAVVRGAYGGWNDRKAVIRVVDTEARPLSKGPIILESACWSPVEDVFYGIGANGALCRVSPDGKSTTVIWSPAAGTRKADRGFSRDAISPDGRFAVLSETTQEPVATRQGFRQIQTIRIVSTENGESRVLWRDVADRVYERGTKWSSDGHWLYVLTSSYDRRNYGQAFRQRYQLLRGSPDEGGLRPIAPVIEASHVRLMVPPGLGAALLLVWQQELPGPGDFGPPRVTGHELLKVEADGRTQRLPTAQWPGFLGSPGVELGFDNRGRLLYLAGDENEVDPMTGEPTMSRVEALDIATGKSERIYP